MKSSAFCILIFYFNPPVRNFFNTNPSRLVSGEEGRVGAAEQEALLQPRGAEHRVLRVNAQRTAANQGFLPTYILKCCILLLLCD